MRNLKQFETHNQYEAAESGLILPNVSICKDQANVVHYNPYVEPVETKLVCKYNVTDTSNPTQLLFRYGGANSFSSMEIDGVVQESVITEYTFSTTGEHTVKYELINSTKVGGGTPAFDGSKLVSVVIPDGVTTIGSNSFSGCRELTNVSMPDSVTTIENYAFTSCSGLTSIGPTGSSSSISIPNGVTTIGDSVFYYCRGLISVNIPSGVTSIGNDVFSYCSSVTSITVDSGNTVYDSRDNCNAIVLTSDNKIIYGCSNTTFPNSVSKIGNRAFRGCSGLTTLSISSGIDEIGESAFCESSISELTIACGWNTRVLAYAFYDCASLTSVTFTGSNMSEVTVGNYCLADCNAMSSISFTFNDVTLGTGALANSSNCPIYVPSDYVNTFKSNYPDYADRVEAL